MRRLPQPRSVPQDGIQNEMRPVRGHRVLAALPHWLRRGRCTRPIDRSSLEPAFHQLIRIPKRITAPLTAMAQTSEVSAGFMNGIPMCCPPTARNRRRVRSSSSPRWCTHWRPRFCPTGRTRHPSSWSPIARQYSLVPPASAAGPSMCAGPPLPTFRYGYPLSGPASQRLLMFH